MATPLIEQLRMQLDTPDNNRRDFYQSMIDILEVLEKSEKAKATAPSPFEIGPTVETPTIEELRKLGTDPQFFCSELVDLHMGTLAHIEAHDARLKAVEQLYGMKPVDASVPPSAIVPAVDLEGVIEKAWNESGAANSWSMKTFAEHFPKAAIQVRNVAQAAYSHGLSKQALELSEREAERDAAVEQIKNMVIEHDSLRQQLEAAKQSGLQSFTGSIEALPAGDGVEIDLNPQPIPLVSEGELAEHLFRQSNIYQKESIEWATIARHAIEYCKSCLVKPGIVLPKRLELMRLIRDTSMTNLSEEVAYTIADAVISLLKSVPNVDSGEVKKLKDELERANTYFSVVSQQRDEMENQRNDVQAQLSTATARIAELEKQLKVKSITVDEIETALRSEWKKHDPHVSTIKQFANFTYRALRGELPCQQPSPSPAPNQPATPEFVPMLSPPLPSIIQTEPAQKITIGCDLASGKNIAAITVTLSGGGQSFTETFLRGTADYDAWMKSFNEACKTAMPTQPDPTRTAVQEWMEIEGTMLFFNYDGWTARVRNGLVTTGHKTRELAARSALDAMKTYRNEKP